jgi:hypothetical protein
MSKINLLASIILLLGTSTALAQDLGDDTVCMECHADTERSEPRRVHNADGSFVQEDHEMWMCIDCHDYITEIPHPEGVTELEVNCLSCHDEVPSTD